MPTPVAGFDSTATFGLMAPAATSAAIVDKIYRAQARLLAAKSRINPLVQYLDRGSDPLLW